MTSPKPMASVSLDLDDLWTYLRTRGDPSWESRPSYLPLFVPTMLDQLDELALRITFFMVGFDATLPASVPYLREIARRGHDIGNHSFNHECWMHLHGPEQLVDEVARSEDLLAEVTGQRPVGFRGPGFSWSPQLLEVLSGRGYLYDASTLPTYLGPLARLYFLATAKLTPEERERRTGLFGSFSDGRRPTAAYNWSLRGGASLLEIPVTTIPVVKTPFHMSYLLYLRKFSRAAMIGYFRSALAACRVMHVQPSLLLHPLDILSGKDVPSLHFFPGMELPANVKRQAVSEVLALLADEFQIVTMRAHADSLLAAGNLRRVTSPTAAPGSDGDRRSAAPDSQSGSRFDHAEHS